jgi:hypothetical protein
MNTLFTCVASGTLVETEGGPREVSDLRVGEKVWGYDLTAGRRVLTPITAMRESIAEETLLIERKLRVTRQHPVYANGKWVMTGKLEAGDTLFALMDAAAPIHEITTIREQVRVYDLTAGWPHNFIAGGFLVHNKTLY